MSLLARWYRYEDGGPKSGVVLASLFLTFSVPDWSEFVKFDVKALRAAAEQTMEADRAAWETKRAEENAALADERAAWLEKWGPEWLAATKAVAAKIRKGQPVVAEDLPRGDRYTSVELWHEGRTRPRGEFRPSESLTTLLQVLAVVADDTVTAAALRNLGISPTTLARCVQRMSRVTAKG